jgi:hypothetical protein
MKQAEVRWFDLDVLDLREGIVVFPFRIAGLNQEAHVSNGSSYQIDSEIANSMMTLVGNSCWRSDFAGHLVEDEANQASCYMNLSVFNQDLCGFISREMPCNPMTAVSRKWLTEGYTHIAFVFQIRPDLPNEPGGRNEARLFHTRH